MQASFWLERWEQGQIGFHQEQANPYLQRHWATLAVPAETRVLVPLCGKSLDLLWLRARGHEVIGVELAQQAIEEFFREHGLLAEVETRRDFQIYRSEGLELWCGDFFALQASDLPDCAAFYDRAALIALPEALRSRYLTHLQAILPASCQGLLISLEYDQAQMDGPPFAVVETEIRQGLSAWQVDLLQRDEVLDDNPRFVQRGLSMLSEAIYHLHRT